MDLEKNLTSLSVITTHNVFPFLVLGQVLAMTKHYGATIERCRQFVGAPDFREGINHSGFTADVPQNLLVVNVALKHAALEIWLYSLVRSVHELKEMIYCKSYRHVLVKIRRLVTMLETHIPVFEPLYHPRLVLFGTIDWDGAFLDIISVRSQRLSQLILEGTFVQ